MQKLNKGEYTGKIVDSFNVNKSIITNTLYSIEKSEPYWHSHENLHISFVLQNGKAETKKNVTYAQKKGSIFFYHSGEIHRWNSPKPVSRSINIEIENDFLQDFNLSEDDIKLSIEKNIDAKAIILKMQKEMQLKDKASLVSVKSLLLELTNYSKLNTKKEIPIWVVTLKDLLNDNWNNQLKLEEMAKIVGVHPVTISKYFRKYFSCTLGEYQRKLKTNKSIDLIRNPNLSLSEIAYLCGFSDQSHFIRNFKEQTNFLPKDFRQL
jgi:AraC family transcriptional regulator